MNVNDLRKMIQSVISESEHLTGVDADEGDRRWWLRQAELDDKAGEIYALASDTLTMLKGQQQGLDRALEFLSNLTHDDLEEMEQMGEDPNQTHEVVQQLHDAIAYLVKYGWIK